MEQQQQQEPSAGSEQTRRRPEPEPEPEGDVAEPAGEPEVRGGRETGTTADDDDGADATAENDGVATAAEASPQPQQQQHEHGEPYEGMCCLCTMEDITVEDGNYVEFQSHPSMRWKPAMFEKCVVEQLLNEQFFQYVERVKKTDCQAELRRLIDAGPPVYISDKHALPLADDGDTHVATLWYADDGEERSGRLRGAVDGVEREELLERLREFIITEGKEPGDDDEEEGGEGEGEGEGAGKDE